MLKTEKAVVEVAVSTRLGCPTSADFTLAWSEEVLIIGCLSPRRKNGIIVHAWHACERGKKNFLQFTWRGCYSWIRAGWAWAVSKVCVFEKIMRQLFAGKLGDTKAAECMKLNFVHIWKRNNNELVNSFSFGQQICTYGENPVFVRSQICWHLIDFGWLMLNNAA